MLNETGFLIANENQHKFKEVIENKANLCIMLSGVKDTLRIRKRLENVSMACKTCRPIRFRSALHTRRKRSTARLRRRALALVVQSHGQILLASIPKKISYDDLMGFESSETAPKIDVMKHYVSGISRDCLK